MRLNTVAPPHLPRQYHALAPHFHRASDCSALGGKTYHQHRTSDGALLGDPTPSSQCTRLSLDTKAEYYLNQLRRGSQYDISTHPTSIWISYLSICVAILLTLSVVFGVGYYLNSVSVEKSKSGKLAGTNTLPAERIFGTRVFEMESSLRRDSESAENRISLAENVDDEKSLRKEEKTIERRRERRTLIGLLSLGGRKHIVFV